MYLFLLELDDILFNMKNTPSMIFFTRIMECPCFYAMQYRHQLPKYTKLIEEFRSVEKEVVRIFMYQSYILIIYQIELFINNN